MVTCYCTHTEFVALDCLKTICGPQYTQVFWTREVTEAIQSGGAKGLGQYAQRYEQTVLLISALRTLHTPLHPWRHKMCDVLSTLY